VACFDDDGRIADELVRVADSALYSAKWAARADHARRDEYAEVFLAWASKEGEGSPIGTQPAKEDKEPAPLPAT
jgi:hypothetical protein